jgi:4a-hydroxytetrahydrobiopterin dehydratase
MFHRRPRTRNYREEKAMSKEKERVYTEAEIPAKLSDGGLTDWKLEDGWLRRKYNTDGWRSTLMLVNAIGFLAEAADHHPDLTVTWAKIWVKLQTHSAGGITDKDFAIARKIEDTALWRPEPGSPLKGAAKNEFVKVEK